MMLGLILLAMNFGGFSMASDLTYDRGYYQYQGCGQLTGTIPYQWYDAYGAGIKNDSTEPVEVTMTLRYGSLLGNYQWSNDVNNVGEQIHWHEIPMSSNQWVHEVLAGEKIWLRVVFRRLNAVSGQWLIYHIQSPSPYGDADGNVGDDYYFGFPPNARYYDSEWNTLDQQEGYVMVVKVVVPE